MKRLNQVIVAEAQAKTSCQEQISKLHHLSSKEDLYSGLSKTYTPLKEEDEALPTEEKRIQVRAVEQIEAAKTAWKDLFDLTLSKDRGNCEAKADLIIDGGVILSGVPVTYLLFLEKRVTDILTFLKNIPVLNEAYDWELGVGGIYRSNEVKTHRTKKVQRGLVLHPPTDKHPAQTQLIVEDVVVGHYHTQHTSGALPHDQKKDLVKKAEKVLRAVKEAREKANIAEAPEADTSPLMDYIFG